MKDSYTSELYDAIIIGAGLYGLYSALYLAKQGKNVVILEYDQEAMQRASYINQARVHLGYHYPRSLATALKSAKYYNRFCDDFNFAINKSFEKIYAISKSFSLTSGEQFQKFCYQANIPCHQIIKEKYFNPEYIETAFSTKEYAFDAIKIKNYLLKKIIKMKVKIIYGSRIQKVLRRNNNYVIVINDSLKLSSSLIVNATYASTNQTIKLFNFPLFKIKYEICEVILCSVNDEIKNKGLTVMDGPFLSLMPFGLTGYHSITSVAHTPHNTSYNLLPRFKCQRQNSLCTPKSLENCNFCIAQPKTAFSYMNQLVKKYLHTSTKIKLYKTLFSIKPILLSSEIDDSRPTIIKTFSKKPTFISVLSGKINTIYDLDNYLNI